jgi:hypothetical protein
MNVRWLKGVNSTALDAAHDLGKDGGNSYFPADLMGFNLHYYQGDYKAINNVQTDPSKSFFGEYHSSPVMANSSNLYNGNIHSMQTTI